MGKGALAARRSGVPGGPDRARACPLAEGAPGQALAGNCLGQFADTEGKGQSHLSLRERSYTLIITTCNYQGNNENLGEARETPAIYEAQ